LARTEARVKTSIWTDSPDFVALPPDAKLVWFSVLSQPKLNLCGVISYTPGSWSQKTGLSLPAVKRAVRKLGEEDFTHLDECTDEFWFRTLTKHDQVLEKPYMVLAMSKDFTTIQSSVIRERFLEGLGPRFIRDLPLAFPKAYSDQYMERFSKPFVDAFHQRFDGGI
jgi:hypothetical protein